MTHYRLLVDEQTINSFNISQYNKYFSMSDMLYNCFGPRVMHVRLFSLFYCIVTCANKVTNELKQYSPNT